MAKRRNITKTKTDDGNSVKVEFDDGTFGIVPKITPSEKKEYEEMFDYFKNSPLFKPFFED